MLCHQSVNNVKPTHTITEVSKCGEEQLRTLGENAWCKKMWIEDCKNHNDVSAILLLELRCVATGRRLRANGTENPPCGFGVIHAHSRTPFAPLDRGCGIVVSLGPSDHNPNGSRLAACGPGGGQRSGCHWLLWNLAGFTRQPELAGGRPRCPLELARGRRHG